MPRTVLSKIYVGLPAHVTWSLRSDFNLEQKIATLGNRKLSILSEKFVNVGLEEEERHRIVLCELTGDVGVKMLGIKTKDLSSSISSKCYVHKFDEEHGARFLVDVAMKRLGVSIGGKQWCVPLDENSCFLFTCLDVSVGLAGFGSMIELQIEKQLRASHEAFPKHACDYFASTPRQPMLPAIREVSEVPETPVFSEIAKPRTKGVPFSKLLFGTSLTRQRRHRALTKDTCSVIVSVRPMHARLLLFCGCANEVDEIVE